MNTLKIAGGIVVAVLSMDALGFMLWVLTAQIPPDNFYLGTITAHIIGTIIN